MDAAKGTIDAASSADPGPWSAGADGAFSRRGGAADRGRACDPAALRRVAQRGAGIAPFVRPTAGARRVLPCASKTGVLASPPTSCRDVRSTVRERFREALDPGWRPA